MIDAAIAKKEAWEREQTQAPGSDLAGIFDIGSAPPDYFDQMGAAITLGVYAGALASMIAGVSSVAATSAASTAAATAAATASAAATANAAMASLAAAGANAASIAATTSGIVANTADLLAVAAVPAPAGLSGATVTGPVLVIVGAIISGILSVKSISKQISIEKKMNELIAWKKTGKVSAAALLGTRDGTMQFGHFFAKATSGSSPGVEGYKNPAEGCRACFYADKNYEGESICTTKGFPNLKAAAYKGDVVKFGGKISSVALDQHNCENSYAVLHDRTKSRGEWKILRSSVADLSVFDRKAKTWDDAAQSAAFYDKDAPQCEVCLYTKQNYGGAKTCVTDGGIGKLSALGLRDKISSVKMNTRDCAKGTLWLYKKNGYVRKANGSGVTEITESTPDLGNGVRNTASSLYFSGLGDNPYEKPASGGCRVCMYDRPDHKGEYMCVNDKISDMKRYQIAGETYDFSNKATSVQMIRDACKKNDAMELEIYTKANYGGKVFRIFGEDVMDLKGVANNVATSAKLHHYDATKTCQVCLYKEQGYQGAKLCFDGEKSVIDSGFNNRVSSIRVEKGACKGGGAILYGEKNFGGKTQEITQSEPDLRSVRRGSGNWNNAVSSVRFSAEYAKLKAQLIASVQAALPPKQANEVDPATRCEVCLYKDKNYSGEKQCISGDAARLGGTLNDSVSSIKVFKGACPRGGATLYKDRNYGGKSIFLLNSNPNLTSMAGTDLNWNNALSSLKFSSRQRDAMAEGMKRVFPMLNAAQIEKQITKTYGE